MLFVLIKVFSILTNLDCSELAEKIAELIHKFPTLEQAVLFFRVFLKTMDREWPGIDKLRLNKFYYLVRCFQKESFIYMARSNWGDEVVDAFNTVLVEGPLSFEAKCTDLKLHMADLFLDELAKSGTFDSGFSSEILLKLLEPYFQLVVRAKDKSVFERGFSRIFESLAGERWLAAGLQDPDDIDPTKLQPLRHTNRMFRHTYIEPIPLLDVCQLFLDRDFASDAS
jgi:ribosomal RNA-processing protein 1